MWFFESTEAKQVKACVEDIKLGLNDPNSFEMISSRVIKVKNGWIRQEIKYTAKNAMGGRVRGEDICGFSSESDANLNANDFINKNRELLRTLRELGIK